MASVFIDIPGVGNVEAKNAATEATLKEILKVMQGVQKNTGGGSGGNKGGSGNNSGGGSGPTSAAGKAAYALGQGFGKLVKTTGIVVGGFDSLSKATTGIIQQFANVGDSVEAAAGIFKGLPIVGTMFGAVASAATKVTRAYTDATAAGATFGGSMASFSAAAGQAGMTMEKFGAFISKNGEALTAFGGTTEDGANRFAKVSKQLLSTSSGLYALGYSTDDINQGLANYGKTLKLQGRQGTMTNAELAAGSRKYLQEMDLLAKVTGESRKQQEDARQKLLMDAQVQAKVNSMSTEAGEAFMNTINGLPPGLRDVAKDIMVTGTATTEEAQKFSSLMPESANLMREYAEITNRGGTVTKEMQQRLQNTMAMEGKSAKAQYEQVGKYNKEMAGTYNMLSQSAAMNKDALTDAEKAQLKAKEETDAMNKRMQEAQQTLAKFSNAFTMALVNSGLLDLLMKSFEVVAKFVMDTVVPIFHILAGVVTTIGGILLATLKPAFESVGGFIAETLYPAFQRLAAFFIVDVIPGIMQTVEELKPVFSAVGTFISEVLYPPIEKVASFIFDNLTPILIGLGVGMAAYAAAKVVGTGIAIANNVAEAVRTGTVMASIAGFLGLNAAMLPFVAIAAGIVITLGVLWAIFKKLGGDTQVLGDLFSLMGAKIKGWWLQLKDGLFSLLNKIPGMRGDFDKDLEEIKKEREENATKQTELSTNITTRMEENKKKAAEEATAKENKRNEVKNQTDIKNIKAQQAAAKAQEDANKDKKAALDEAKNIDYNASSVDVLKQYAAKEGSAFIKTPENKAAAGAESARASAVATTEQERVAAQQAAAKKAEEEKAKAGVTGGGGGSTAPTQESATSLLASLNTKMDQLIRINRNVNEIAESQLSVQKGMTGNLYKAV